MMVGCEVTICKFRYSHSRNMNWALDRHWGWVALFVSSHLIQKDRFPLYLQRSGEREQKAERVA